MAWFDESPFVLSRSKLYAVDSEGARFRKSVGKNVLGSGVVLWANVLLGPTLLVTLLLAGFAHADPPSYGKVETFQPGKKYNCVPTPDHKAWDCNESGRAAEAKQSEPKPPEEAPSKPAPLQTAAPPASASAEPVQKSSALPSYLTNAAAREQARTESAAAPKRTETPAPSTPQASTAPPRTAEPKSAQIAPPSAPATAPASPPAEPDPAPVSAPPQPVSAPAPQTPPAQIAAPGDNMIAGNREFLALPPASYVVEIAHSANRAELVALRANLHIHLGELYELHLSRDGADWWLLVWGHFADIESARAARSDLPADAAVNAGWPRRIAPLQAEVRHATE